MNSSVNYYIFEESSLRTIFVVLQVAIAAIAIVGLMWVLKSSLFYKSENFEDFFSNEWRILITDEWSRKDVRKRINERINTYVNWKKERSSEVTYSDLGK